MEKSTPHEILAHLGRERDFRKMFYIIWSGCCSSLKILLLHSFQMHLNKQRVAKFYILLSAFLFLFSSIEAIWQTLERPTKTQIKSAQGSKAFRFWYNGLKHDIWLFDPTYYSQHPAPLHNPINQSSPKHLSRQRTTCKHTPELTEKCTDLSSPEFWTATAPLHNLISQILS